ncbi:type II secretion system protein [Candidatus Avelusimicrobium luingense]|uniref:type II secretion system protein n=1 Tax=Candidatus Avelusimicrobium luingense TaxID=3416211 RepID=UPI003D0AA1E3
MKNKKGFTLLELLIAATIIGAMAVFATISYRSSEADARIAAAKAKTEVLAGAVQRFRLEFPYAALGNSVITNTTATCPDSMPYTQSLSATTLISCGLLDNGGWTNDFVEFTICGIPSNGGICAALTGSTGACMTGKSSNSRVPDRYRWSSTIGNSYWYCVKSTGEPGTEHFRS